MDVHKQKEKRQPKKDPPEEEKVLGRTKGVKGHTTESGNSTPLIGSTEKDMAKKKKEEGCGGVKPGALFTPEILKEEIDRKEILGEGTGGKVWKGLLRGSIVAVKELKNKLQNTEQFRREVEIMTQIRHPNVILFMGACYDPPYIVTEFLENGDLHNLIKKVRQNMDAAKEITVSNSVITEMLHRAVEVARGMAWLHQSKPPIIHKDLKPSNIMIDCNGHAKIIDFGLSEVQKQKEMENKRLAGSAAWMAPEMLIGHTYTIKLDVYAFGIILWQLCTASPEIYDVSRYQDNTPINAFQKFASDIVENNLRPELPSSLVVNHESIVDIMTASWSAEPSKRPAFSDIITKIEGHLINTILWNDSDAIQMWKTNFGEKTAAPIQEFIQALWKVINPKQLDKEIAGKCIIAVTGEMEEYITLEKFGLLLYWYGPLCPLVNNFNLLQKLVELLRQQWYHGELSSLEAEKRFNDKSEGWLIRCSVNMAAPFVLSRIKKTNKDVQKYHHRINYNRSTGIYKMQMQNKDISGETLPDLVKYAKKELNLSFKKVIVCTEFNGIFSPTGEGSYMPAFK